jgi:hypothetical protein
VQQIVRHCPTLTELHLDMEEWVRPDHLEYLQRRRAGTFSIMASNMEPWIQFDCIQPRRRYSKSRQRPLRCWNIVMCNSGRGNRPCPP